MSMLRIDQVSKLYRTGSFGGRLVPALRQVSFDVSSGEVVTLIGESGSGKTTLGRIVLRLTPASGGQVTFEGQDISAFSGPRLREYYRRVQGVFQDPFSSYNPIYRADRVLELVRGVYFPHLSRPAWQDKIEAALHAVALNPGDVLGRYPHQLSGGQQQRLLIARALLLDVKLLVADEIISMLDASTRVDILNLLIDLKRAGLAILFITHDLSLGHYVSDRTVILRRGAIVEMGDTVKVFGDPRHPYTKNLLAAVPELHKKWRRPAGQAETGGTEDADRSDALTGGTEDADRSDALTGAAEDADRSDALAGGAEDADRSDALTGGAEDADRSGALIPGAAAAAADAADGRAARASAATEAAPGRARRPGRTARPIGALEPPPLVPVGPGHLVAGYEP